MGFHLKTLLIFVVTKKIHSCVGAGLVFKGFTGRSSDNSLKYILRCVSGNRTIALSVLSNLTSIQDCDIKKHSFGFCLFAQEKKNYTLSVAFRSDLVLFQDIIKEIIKVLGKVCYGITLSLEPDQVIKYFTRIQKALVI